MSAFMVGKVHVDAMLTAGMRWARYGPLRWMERDLTDDDKAAAYERGEPWGAAATELYSMLRRSPSPTCPATTTRQGVRERDVFVTWAAQRAGAR